MAHRSLAACVAAVLVPVLAPALVPGTAAAAETSTVPGQYLAIGVEAEATTSSDERWIFTDPSTVATEETSPDPDGNHSDGAAGGAYLELLPDHRVTHDDTEFPPGTPGWYWGSGGQGPEVAFAIDFPEPGRYYVHARTYSTGSEDNGIHVGLDGEWPASGERIQWCAKNRWVWSSQQRGGPKAEHCGKGERTIWLDVTEAGEHTVAFSAREDGFELDRFMLIKDLSDGTRLCLPSGADGIDCQDADLEAIDGFVDVGVTLEAEPVEGESASRRDVVATVRNLDGKDGASVITLDVSLGDAWTLVRAEDGCEQAGDALVCAIGDLGPGDAALVTFTLEATRVGTLVLDAAVSANEDDDDPANDDVGIEIPIEADAAPSLTASIDLAADTVAVGDGVTVRIVLDNAGDGDAGDVGVALSIPDALEVGSVSDGCTNARPVTCTVDSIPAGESVTLDMTLVGADPAVAATLLLDVSAADLGPMNASAAIEVVAAAPEGEEEEGENGGGNEDGTDGAESDPGDGDGASDPDGDEAPGDTVEERLAGGDTSGGGAGDGKVSSGGGALGAGLLGALVGAALVRRRRSVPAAVRS